VLTEILNRGIKCRAEESGLIFWIGGFILPFSKERKGKKEDFSRFRRVYKLDFIVLRMRVLEVLVMLMLFSALGFGSYALWLNYPREDIPYAPYSANFSGANSAGFTDGLQFYPNMRFPEKRISYRLESACEAEKWRDIERAFEILQNKTILSFYSTFEEPEIKVLCSEAREEEAEQKGYFIAGEGGPNNITNATAFAVISQGEISLYKEEKCDEPKIAIHEILHALGFGHINKTNSIMYPVSDCAQEIDRDVIEEINRLYAIESAPDVLIEEATAKRAGRYLDFNITLSNNGIVDSNNVTLYVYSDGEKADSFPVGKIDIGMKKKLSAQNVKVSSSARAITFSASSEDRDDLNPKNNIVELALG
jgi:hypothetical protein